MVTVVVAGMRSAAKPGVLTGIDAISRTVGRSYRAPVRGSRLGAMGKLAISAEAAIALTLAPSAGAVAKRLRAK
jgi:hypothetical protein